MAKFTKEFKTLNVYSSSTPLDVEGITFLDHIPHLHSYHSFWNFRFCNQYMNKTRRQQLGFSPIEMNCSKMCICLKVESFYSGILSKHSQVSVLVYNADLWSTTIAFFFPSHPPANKHGHPCAHIWPLLVRTLMSNSHLIDLFLL